MIAKLLWCFEAFATSVTEGRALITVNLVVNIHQFAVAERELKGGQEKIFKLCI